MSFNNKLSPRNYIHIHYYGEFFQLLCGGSCWILFTGNFYFRLNSASHLLTAAESLGGGRGGVLGVVVVVSKASSVVRFRQ